MRGAIVISLLALASPAHAGDDVSPGAAAAISIVGAIGGELAVTANIFGSPKTQASTDALVTTAAVLAPSLGQWYAGRSITPGLLIRAAGGAMIFYGEISIYCRESSIDTGTGGCFPGAARSDSLVLPLVGLGTYTVGAIMDASGAADSAREHNRAHATIAPAVLPGPTGPAPGLYFSATY